MSTTGGGLPAGVATLIFDVLGTVVDEAGSVAAETARALVAAGAGTAQANHVATEWTRRVEALTGQVAAREAPWRSNDALRREALLEALRAAGPDGLPPAMAGDRALAGDQALAADQALAGDRALADQQALIDDLALVGHRLRPWPDSPRGLHALAGRFTVVALSNASLAQLASMSAAGGLAWHCVLSAELTRAYKPDPSVYRMALDLLGLDPRHTMMIAAHPWDLRAAAGHGMRTGYIARPGEGTPAADDRFDVYATDLADLAQRLMRDAGPAR
jgi:2-haloacid dehalogenase